MTSCYTESTLFETDTSFIIQPCEAAKGEACSVITIDKKDPLHPVCSEHASGTVVPPSPSTRRGPPLTIYGVLGLLPFSATDVRLIVITSRECVGNLPQPLWKVTGTKVIKLSSSTSPNSAKWSALIDRLLSVKSLFYANDWDCTHSTQRRVEKATENNAKKSMWERAEDKFFWNRYISQALIDAGADRWVVPTFMGYAALKTVGVKGEEVTLGLISRRSRFRAGMRLFMRGIDEEGHVANEVETEQLLMIRGKPLASYVETRGSIPALWSQLPNVAYKPPMVVTGEREANINLAKTHFEGLTEMYGGLVSCVSLIDHKGKELVLAEEYAAISEALNNLNSEKIKIKYTSFDFHKECKGGKTEKLSILLDQIRDDIANTHYYSEEGESRQVGIFRVNCIDNLDRTNVVQTLIGRVVLEAQLRKYNILTSESDSISSDANLLAAFKTIWADNADAISTQYTGTGAQKNDITRTGKRTFKGMLDDGVNAMTRYYKNNFADGDMQDAYNLFLGVFNPLKDGEGKAAPAGGLNLGACLMALVVVGVILMGVGVKKVLSGSDVLCGIIICVICFLVFKFMKSAVKNHGRQLVNNPKLVKN